MSATRIYNFINFIITQTGDKNMHPSDFSKRKEHVFQRYAHKISSNRNRPVSTFPTQKRQDGILSFLRWSNEPSARRGEPYLVIRAICFLSGMFSCLFHLSDTFSDPSRAEPSKGEAFERRLISYPLSLWKRITFPIRKTHQRVVIHGGIPCHSENH